MDKRTKVVNGKTYVLYAGRWHVKVEAKKCCPDNARVLAHYDNDDVLVGYVCGGCGAKRSAEEAK